MDGKVSAYVLVGQTPHQIYLALGQLRTFLYPATAIALLLAAATVWLLVWWSMRPLERLDAAAAEISSTRDHTRRVEPGRPSDEIGHLSRSINTMLSALEDAYRQVQNVSELQRHFLADVSHELRRPLTIMLSSLDILTRVGDEDPSFQAQTLSDMRIEIDRMARMVTQLLILARTDSAPPCRVSRFSWSMSSPMLAVKGNQWATPPHSSVRGSNAWMASSSMATWTTCSNSS